MIAVFSEYVEKAMHKASYELIEDGTYFGEIAGFQGVWGSGKSVEECRTDLRDALEGWLVLGLWEHHEDIPVLGGLNLIPQRVELPKQNKKRESASSPRTRKAS